MGNLAVPLHEKAEEGAKRALSVCKKIFSEKGRHLAKSMIKSFAVKWLGREMVDELEHGYAEWMDTPSARA